MSSKSLCMKCKHTVNASPASEPEPLRAEAFGVTAKKKNVINKHLRKVICKTNKIYCLVKKKKKKLSLFFFSFFFTYRIIPHLKAVLFSAPSHLAVSRWRCPRPRQHPSSSGPGCCSCSHGAPEAPYAPAGCAGAALPSPACV